MKVIQIIPELNAGGVELCTVELAEYLKSRGHEALVVSNGGRLVARLERAGVRHVALPVHRKRPGALLQIAALRRLFLKERPDIVHIGSRLPGWLAWLAVRSLPAGRRPRFFSTVHGFYTPHAYSGIMTRGERVVAVSQGIADYVVRNYPRVNQSRLHVVYNGVDTSSWSPDHAPSAEWRAAWRARLAEDAPEAASRRVIMLPARLTRWKGQEDFIKVIARLVAAGEDVQGVLVGDAHPKKMGFRDELLSLTKSLGVGSHLTFLGHRSDMRDVMTAADIVCSFSLDPEAFGRVTLEALALGKPVVAYGHGGVKEQLEKLFPSGLVSPRDVVEATERIVRVLRSRPVPVPITPRFTLEHSCSATVDLYRELVLSARP